MRRRDFLKAAASLAAAGVLMNISRMPTRAGTASRKLKLRYFAPDEHAKMIPAPPESLRRIYLMDADYNPLMLRADLGDEPGTLVVPEPDHPFKITSADWVTGFGYVYLVADNGGSGYAPGELGSEVDLNREVARSRLKAVESAKSAAAGEVFGPGIRTRLDKARQLLNAAGKIEDPSSSAARAWEALNEGLWAGEMFSFERAKHAISARGPRAEFKFAANAFGALTQGEAYSKAFYEIFDYCTLPFYYKGFEPEEGKPTWGRLDSMVQWCQVGKITPKGHPLLWMHEAGVPAWLEDKSFGNVKRLHQARIRDIVGRYKGRIDYWDVINEAHDFANVLNFTYDQLLDLTRMCCDTARSANPGCTSVINSTMLWGEYAAPQPGQDPPATPRRTPYQYVSQCVRERLDFDVIGLQIYFPNRDMFEIDRMLDRYSRFGKQVHITEQAISSDPSDDDTSHVRKPSGEWHAPFSPSIQADWIEQLWTIAYSKDFVTAVTYWDFADSGGHFWPHGGFLDKDLKPKESYFRLKHLIDSWKGPGK